MPKQIPTALDAIRKICVLSPEPEDAKGWNLRIKALRRRIKKLEQGRKEVQETVYTFERAIDRELDKLDTAVDVHRRLTGK